MGIATTQALIAFLAVAVTSAVTYAIARRKTSGNVATSSDAAQLWAESQTLRKELRDEVRALREMLSEREKRITSLEQRITALESRLDG